MRIKEPFAKERISENNLYKKKYFIASEGSTTEPTYFNKLNDNVIKENTVIINILRDYANQGYSNPTKVVKLLQTFLDNSFFGITVDELKNRLSNWNYENSNKIDINSIFKKIDDLYEKDDYLIYGDELERLFMTLFKNEVYSDLINNFKRYFETQNVTFSPEVDSLSMVIDRDKESFTEKQYDSVVEFCEKNNINLYVSNPNFELWLYMHFDEFDNENFKDLMENKKVNNSGRRYIEQKLRDLCGYKKNYIKFENFKPGIMKAIERTNKFPEDAKDLKSQIGTNVGHLVKKIINEK